MAATVKVEGAKELRKKLRGLGSDLKDLKAVHKEAAEVVKVEAQAIVPVRSGTLRGTLRASAQQTSAKVRAGFARVPYAGVIHFGWPRHNIRPNPFLFDALDSRRGEVLKKYEAGINKLKRENKL